MTDVARRHVVLGGALALLGLLVGALLVTRADNDRGKSAGHGLAWSRPSSLTISGDATEPIAPGSSAAIDLKFANRRRLPLTVTDVRVRVREVRAPNADATHPCSVSDYQVEQVPGDAEITIPAGGTRALSGLGLSPRAWPRVGLVDRSVNQDGCRGASLVLGYSASGAIAW